MEEPLHVIWTVNGQVLRGIDLADGQWKNAIFNFGVTFPNKLTEPKEVLLTTNALRRRSADILTGVKLRLDGDDATLALFRAWDASGYGIEISMDGGVTYSRLSEAGMDLKASAISMDAVDGQLGPLDTARLLLRARIPASYSTYGKLNFRLAVDCDVI
jgi:hypothetical protein